MGVLYSDGMHEGGGLYKPNDPLAPWIRHCHALLTCGLTTSRLKAYEREMSSPSVLLQEYGTVYLYCVHDCCNLVNVVPGWNDVVTNKSSGRDL